MQRVLGSQLRFQRGGKQAIIPASTQTFLSSFAPAEEQAGKCSARDASQEQCSVSCNSDYLENLNPTRQGPYGLFPAAADFVGSFPSLSATSLLARTSSANQWRSSSSLGAWRGGTLSRARSAAFPALTSWPLEQQQQQIRGMFIQTQPTPNPTSLKFLPGSPVLPGDTAEYSSARSALVSPLAIALFRLDGVTRVFLGSDFITVTKADDASWDVLKPEIFAAIMDFYSSGKPVIDPSAVSASSDSGEGDSEIVEMIKELLETRIRPAVQEDGGDIDFHSFDEESGVVTLRMRGACSGCPSSAVTLKGGVESMLMHYIPEVTSVEQLMEDEEPSPESSSTSTGTH